MTTSPPRTRDDALDALRGLAIIGMVLANLQGSEKDTFPLLAHAAWNGLTIADLVFPLFLLCAGLALPLAFDGRRPRPAITRIVRRSVLLYLIGFSIGFLVHASTHLIDIRFTGVLARIAVVYLACALLTRATCGWLAPALAATMLIAAHGVLLCLVPPAGIASMAPGEGMSGWLDRAILGGTRLYGKSFDPEGPLSTLSAIATGMVGVAVMRAIASAKRPARFLAIIAAVSLIVGIGASRIWPINKALWTPSFVLVNAAIGLGLFGLLKLAWRNIAQLSPVRLGVRLGRNALTLYVIHALLTAVLVIPVDGERLWLRSFRALAQLGLPLDWTSLLFAIIAGAISVAITLAMERRGWALRL